MRDRIKPGSSKEVARRMAGLHIKDKNNENFAKIVEDLADALGKAFEMAMESTVKVCRNNAKSNMVNAILASNGFTEPKNGKINN